MTGRAMLSVLVGCAALMAMSGAAMGQRHGGGSHGGGSHGGGGGNSGRTWIEPSRSWGVGAGFNRVATPGHSRPAEFNQPSHRSYAPSHSGTRLGVSIGGYGTSVVGTYYNDNVRVGVNLGSTYAYGRNRYVPSDACPPTNVVYVPTYPRYYNDTYVNTPRTVVVAQDTYYTTPGVPVTQVVEAPMVVTQPETVRVVTSGQPDVRDALQGATALEAGAAAMLAGDYARAVTHLRAQVRENATDAKSMRLLAVALLADGRTDDAAAMVRGAYRQNTMLAIDPLVPADAGMTPRQVRDLVSRAVIQANRDNSASSWLLVAVLMQAEGRGELAGTMLQRAQKQGLEPAIVDALTPEMRE